MSNSNTKEYKRSDPFEILYEINDSLYSDPLTSNKLSRQKRDPSPEAQANVIARKYLEASFAANIPSLQLSDPFIQAGKYKAIVYLGIQHFFRSLSGVMVGLEQPRKGVAGAASPGAEPHDPDYIPFDDHPLLSIIRSPNPADTFPTLLCKMIMNWFLHGRILLWGPPNPMGAPERLYCLPVPLVTPGFNIGSALYPLGAWRVQQYYPSTGLSGILPTGLAGSAGAVIDAREVYELKNPHPIWTFSPYSPLVGIDVQVDLIELIDQSFWSLMSQGIRPTGVIDAPGAGEETIKAIQAKIDNEHGGAHKHGKPLVIGGGDPDRPGAKWQPFYNSDGTPHSEGWDRYAGVVLAMMGLDLAVVGLSRTGSYAERWAAKKDVRDDTYIPFLSMIAELLTRGPVTKWGLADEGIRVILDIPQPTGYEPGEMSRDMAADGTGTVNEIRALRGFDRLPDGDVPATVYAEVKLKELGLDQVSQQIELMEAQAELMPEPAPGSSSGSSTGKKPAKKNGKGGRQTQSDEGQEKNPDSRSPKARPDKKKTAGSRGGKGNSPTKKAGKSKKTKTKSFDIISVRPTIPIHTNRISDIVQKVLNTPVYLNGQA